MVEINNKGVTQAKERLDRINEIWRMVHKKPTGWPKKKLIAVFCLKYGQRKRTVQEYIGLLLDADKLEERNGRLFG